MQKQTTSNDPFLHKVIDNLHDTPMQRKLQRLAPMPVGVVFLPWPGMTEAEAREHFRTMKKLGFTCLKQTMGTLEWPTERTLALAMEEGIYPFWYAEGGFEDVTPALLEKLGLPKDMEVDAALENPKMLEYQRGVIRRRIDRDDSAPMVATGEHQKQNKDVTWVPGVVGDIKGHVLHTDALPHYVEWLRRQYGTVERLLEAWNMRHVGIGGEREQWKTWEDVLAALKDGVGGREYRRLRDALRFRADTFTRQYVTEKVQNRTDKEEPLRAGGEMGLFLSFASRGTDMEQIAEAMAEGGSFYPSIHLAWHFEEVDFEVARPMYMQAQTSTDWAKGIWSATWESTGGPQYFSGGKAPFVEGARNRQPGFTTDDRTMGQLMFSWLAAGFKGFGLWAWNARTAGWEAGEYALLDRNRNVTPRTVRAGQIGQAACKYRRELWEAHKEPIVGILQDWENEAYWAAMSVTGRDFYKGQPIRARIGVSRAFINANVPWEYVTPTNLKRGLGPRYQCIYVPAFISLGTELLQMLHDYVQQGGRLVIDMPGAYYDDFGRIFNTDKGSLFERTFGAVLNEFNYANVHTPHTIRATKGNQAAGLPDLQPVEGFTCQLTPTGAKVLANFVEYGEKPAVTAYKNGKGTAIILASQASLNCFKPGNEAMERFIVRHTLGDIESPYSCDGVLCYRLASPLADHYFLVNDSAETTVKLDTKDYQYKSASDAVTGETIALSAPIKVEGVGGRWLRFEKK